MILKDGDVIKYFSHEMQKEIVKFCDRINGTDADVFVLMARKAACFFQVLLENGYINSALQDKLIVTDRAVDYSMEYIKGKRIAIIDDVIFSGTTIAKMINYLESFEPSNIEIIVLAVNSDTCKMQFRYEGQEKEFLSRNECARLDNVECTRLCSNISRALSMLGKPYDVDFPAYDDVFSESGVYPWVDLLQYFKWINVSNNYQRKEHIDAFTIIPTNLFEKVIWNYLGYDLSDYVIFKLRVYSFCNDKKVYRSKYLPMALLQEMTLDTLDRIFNIICQKFHENTVCLTMFKNNTAKFRFVQYYLAHLFMQLFCSIAGLDLAILKKYSIPYLFGYDYNEEIFGLLQSDMNTLENNLGYLKEIDKETIKLEKDSLEIDMLNYEEEKEPKSFSSAYDINDILLAPFQYWFQKKEISVRDELANENITLDRKQFFSGITRLEEGFSFNALVKVLTGIQHVYDVKEVVSVFLDRAVDLGILVPIIYLREGKIICRAYRHGEDLPYCNIDSKLLDFFVKCFFDKVKYSISRNQLHQIITLFMQMGSKQDLFNEFKNYDYSDLLTIEYAVDGAVPVIVKSGNEDMHPYVTLDDYSVWLSKDMEKRGILLRENDTHFRVNTTKIDVKVKEIPDNLANTTKLLASLLAEWFVVSVKKEKKSVFTEDITMLTTCHDTSSFASALLADLYVCQLDVEATILPMLEKQKEEVLADYFSINMRQGNAFFAMNNGRKKNRLYSFDSGADNRVKEIINNVTEVFRDEDDLFGELAWQQQWSNYIKIIPGENELDIHILKAVRYIYCYNILYRKIEQCYNPNRWNKIEREIHDLQSEIDFVHLEDGLRFEQYDWTNNETFINYARILNSVVRQQMLSIEQAVVKNRNSYTQVFDGCVIVQVASENKYRVADIFERLWEQVHAKSSVIWFELQEPQKELFVMLNKFEKSQAKDLVDIAIKMQHAFDKQSINAKIMVIPQLPDGKKYEQNIKNSNENNKRYFKDNTVRQFQGFFTDNVFMSPEFVVVDKNVENAISMSENFVDMITKNLPNYVVENEQIRRIPFCEKEFCVMNFSNMQKKIGIITVISEEAKAVYDYFDMKKLEHNSSGQKSDRIYYGTDWTKKKQAYSLIMTQCSDPGNDAALATFMTMSHDFNLDYIVLLGVAGSIAPDTVGICDVVIAKQVIDGQLGKEGNEGVFLPQTNIYLPSAKVNTRINSYMMFANSNNNISAEGSPQEKFKCVYEPIGDNNHVIVDTNSKFVVNAKQNINRKIVAVETESAGVMHGAYNASLDFGCENVIIVRGISDCADVNKSKDNKFHYPAAKNAARVFDDLLEFLY